MFGKEAIGPAEVIDTSATAGAATPAAKDTAQTHAYPAVQRGKGRVMTVFEVLKPAREGPVHIQDDRRKTVTVGALGLGSETVFQFPETLGPRPSHTPLKVITQKIEPASGGRIDDPGLGGVQTQTGLGRPVLNKSQRNMRLSLRPAQRITKSSAYRTIWTPCPASRWSRGSR